jgi:hypothetical protein
VLTFSRGFPPALGKCQISFFFFLFFRVIHRRCVVRGASSCNKHTENMAAICCILHPIYWPQSVEISWLFSCNVLNSGAKSASLFHIVTVAVIVIERRHLYVPIRTDTVSWRRVSDQVLKTVISASSCVSRRRVSA